MGGLLAHNNKSLVRRHSGRRDGKCACFRQHGGCCRTDMTRLHDPVPAVDQAVPGDVDAHRTVVKLQTGKDFGARL